MQCCGLGDRNPHDDIYMKDIWPAKHLQRQLITRFTRCHQELELLTVARQGLFYLDRGNKNRQFLANKSPYLRNGARQDQSYY